VESPVRSWKILDVIAEIDIWRAATLMLKRYGDRALEESAVRADELASAGDDNGVAVWRRISTPVRCWLVGHVFPKRAREAKVKSVPPYRYCVDLL
jgi:hypothetical protein